MSALVTAWHPNRHFIKSLIPTERSWNRLKFFKVSLPLLKSSSTLAPLFVLCSGSNWSYLLPVCTVPSFIIMADSWQKPAITWPPLIDEVSSHSAPPHTSIISGPISTQLCNYAQVHLCTFHWPSAKGLPATQMLFFFRINMFTQMYVLALSIILQG